MTKSINLLITVPFKPEHISFLKEHHPSINITHYPNFKEEPIPAEIWAETEILYTLRIVPELEEAPNLRWIQFHVAGVDQFIDHPTLQTENINVSTLSGANAPQTAEHALALLLALSHNIPSLLADQSRSKWSTRRSERFQPRELYKSTVGIVGYGSVGLHLARLLQPFNVTILASKRELLHPEDNGYEIGEPQETDAELVHRLYPGRAMRSMFKDCDFVVLTLPLTKETRNMISSKQMAAMKESAFLVDVSRGGVLDHDALIQSLNDESFAGAALDVFPDEPLPADSPLWDMPNVLISPHIAGFSPNYNKRAIQLFSHNLSLYLSGEEILNKVDPERGY